MRSLSIIIYCLCLAKYCVAQQYFVAYNPYDCTNCNKGIEMGTDENNSVYFFEKKYEIDSVNLKKRYLFSDNADIVFSDSLFNKYSIGGRSTISNKDATLRCLSSNFSREASDFFSKVLSNKATPDTINCNYPISKMSISKYQFTDDGKIYLLDAFDNSIVLYDFLSSNVISTLRMDEKNLKEVYKKFNLGDSSAYSYYKKGTANFTKDDLSTIKDIYMYEDTLYVSLSNYYFYISGKNMNDSFFTHFQSIAVYKNNQYIKSYVPSTIKDKLIDTTVKFSSEPTGLYVYGGNVYTAVHNGRYYSGPEKYVIGKYAPSKDNLSEVVKLSDNLNGDYNFTNPYYSSNFLILSKSTPIQNLSTGEIIDLHYFEQEFYKNSLSPNYPKYCNYDFKVDSSYFNILYYSTSPDITIYFARIDRKTNKIIYNKPIPRGFKNMKLSINPYNHNSILALYDNNRMIVCNVIK